LIVGLSILVFTSVILLLIFILMVAEKQLIPAGDISILVNDKEEPIIVSPGSTLLSALAAQKIFLPSACGGGGTCAMCKCQVIEGGGDILPTEQTHINRAQAKDNWRLSCQVKVKEDLKIKIPEEIFNIKKFHGTVVSNHNVATFIKEFSVELPEPINYQAGGYMQLDVPEYHNMKFKDFNVEKEYHPDWDKFNVWGLTGNNDEACYRAYSMASYPEEGNIIKFNIRIATPPPPKWNEVPPGIASSYIFSLKPGDTVTWSGPFGEFFIKDTDREMIYVGGGAGMAPLRSHIFHLIKTCKTGRKISYWYGARSLREVFYQEEFQKIADEHENFSFHLALSEPLPEDNWEGSTGFIHQVVMDEYLGKHDDPTEVEYYLCGPPMMLSAVQKMLYDLGVEKEMIAFDDFG